MSEHAQPEMSDADVLSALQEAVSQDTAAEQAGPVTSESPAPAQAGAPVEGAPQVGDQAPAQSAEDGGVEQSAHGLDVPFNPDELPEELVPAWRQLQAAFTPKLQEAAQIRRTFEELGGLDVIQQAVELRNRIADPSNWPDLYEELYQAMEQAGFEFEDPAAPTPPAQAPFDSVADDPDLAPLISELQQLRSRMEAQDELLARLEQEQSLRQEMAEQELRQTQYLAQMSRAVSAIRQANPHYDDEDIRAIIEIGTFYGDDLLTAQQRYEDIVARRLERYLQSKRTPTPPSVQPVAGAGVLSHEDSAPETLEDAEAEAVELLRRLQATGELDFA